MIRLGRSGWAALLIYLALVIALVSAMWAARGWALAEMTTADAQVEWNTWRDDVAERRDPQSRSVARRVPQSSEPPVVVLMRDYFVVCLVGALLFSSLVYGVVTWLLIGALAKR